jgi:hypothetical protein
VVSGSAAVIYLLMNDICLASQGLFTHFFRFSVFPGKTDDSGLQSDTQNGAIVGWDANLRHVSATLIASKLLETFDRLIPRFIIDCIA